MSEESASDAGPGGNDDREPPPILGSWSRVYALVVADLAVVIVLLYLLTRRFS